MKRLLYNSVVVASVLSLAACGSMRSSVHSWLHTKENPKPVHVTQLNQSAEQYLQLAATAPSPQQEYYQLMAVEKLIQQSKTTRAAQILSTVNTYKLPNDIAVKKQLLFAKVQLADQRPELALQALRNVPVSDNMDKTDAMEIHQIMANCYEKSGNIVASIEQRNLLDPLLNKQQARSQNQLRIWESVQHLPEEQIKDLLSQPLSPDIRGWLELAQVAQQSSLYPENLIDQLNRWKQSHPQHSGNDLLPRRMNYNTGLLTKSPRNIYLLLPLHGKFGKNGQAVRNGFMAAFYDGKKRRNTRTSVNIIDTSHGNIADNYHLAVNKGADFIVGPLTKSKIQELSQHTRLTVPTVALNYIPNLQSPNLYQFGLSQFDEAEQVANQADQDGYHRAIVIAPKSSFGQTVAERFKTIWQERGHEVVDELAYKNSNDLSKPIRNLLEVNKSEQRAKSLEKVLREKVRYIPNRRNDIDMIFLVALPQQARSIRPMLKFYYAGNIPVYATSLIYEPSLSSQKNRDLDDIHFMDMPWVIGGLKKPLASVQQKAKKLWRKSYKGNIKFYALGVDAYELTTSLSQLAIFPHYGVAGATGTLYLKEDQHIYRKLKWATMKNGRPKEII